MDRISEQVELTSHGYYRLKTIPGKKELAEYYHNKYFQTSQGNYSRVYTPEEKQFFFNKNNEKFFVIQSILGKETQLDILDIGCGEGFTMDFFLNHKMRITGIDYSSDGIKKHNPHCLNHFIEGDIFSQIQTLINQQNKYNVIWLDNVLEHVTDPEELLRNCLKLSAPEAVLVIEVPNDFSEIQMLALSSGSIKNPFWIVSPDHISYFSSDSLNRLAQSSGWKNETTLADFPIDFNLLNENANYINDKSKGRAAHLQRITIDNLIHNHNIEDVTTYYKALAKLGLGRQIIGFFTPEKSI